MADPSFPETKPALQPEQLQLLQRLQQFNLPVHDRRPFPFDRFEAMMLCLAIGDSLGNSCESQVPTVRHARHGEITTYILNRKVGDARGYPSDDTQLAFWTLEQLIENGRIVPEELLGAFATRRVFGMGGTVREAKRRYLEGADWTECGVASAANGALMRIAPLFYHAVMGRPHRLMPDTILATAVTHNDSMAIASSAAAVQVLRQ